jgi:hypothetical protein
MSGRKVTFRPLFFQGPIMFQPTIFDDFGRAA